MKIVDRLLDRAAQGLVDLSFVIEDHALRSLNDPKWLNKQSPDKIIDTRLKIDRMRQDRKRFIDAWAKVR